MVKYLYMVLNSCSNRNKILKLCTENSRQARITVAMLEQLSIPVLTMEQQEELSNRYNNAVKQLKQVQNGIFPFVKKSFFVFKAYRKTYSIRFNEVLTSENK